MRIRVRKPRGGRTTVVIDDRRGRTGLFEILEDVTLEDMDEAVKAVLDRWEKARKAIADARRLSLS